MPKGLNTILGTIQMVLKKCGFCYEERECEKYEPDGCARGMSCYIKFDRLGYVYEACDFSLHMNH
jgi:hypothetical protein